MVLRLLCQKAKSIFNSKQQQKNADEAKRVFIGKHIRQDNRRVYSVALRIKVNDEQQRSQKASIKHGYQQIENDQPKKLCLFGFAEDAENAFYQMLQDGN